MTRHPSGVVMLAGTGLFEATAGSASLLLRQLAASVRPDPELAGELARALVEGPPALMRDGGAIRAGYDPELDGIRDAWVALAFAGLPVRLSRSAHPALSVAAALLLGAMIVAAYRA